LSAIERLAKDPRPAFVIVLRLAPDGREVAGYLIHLIGQFWKRILRRLRRARRRTPRYQQSHDQPQPPGAGRRFELSPEGLRAVIDEACGSPVTGYVAEKQRQLDERGL